MTSTDELRILLDERGVEYEESIQGNSTFFQFGYCEECGDYMRSIVVTGECISVCIDYLTPEFAIAATLGMTCKNINQDYPSLFECSECNWECADTYCCDSEFNYCPNCGAKVVER